MPGKRSGLLPVCSESPIDSMPATKKESRYMHGGERSITRGGGVAPDVEKDASRRADD